MIKSTAEIQRIHIWRFSSCEECVNEKRRIEEYLDKVESMKRKTFNEVNRVITLILWKTRKELKHALHRHSIWLWHIYGKLWNILQCWWVDWELPVSGYKKLLKWFKTQDPQFRDQMKRQFLDGKLIILPGLLGMICVKFGHLLPNKEIFLWP